MFVSVQRLSTLNHYQATYEELRGRGVEFSEEPNEQPWGMWARFKDVDGNEFGLIQS
jgi:predicted enzyme related to lactoylglutathione lyase